MRKRISKHTSEDGPAEEKTSVTVGRCSGEGQYKTIYPHDIVRNKQYCLSEIQSTLDGRNDCSLASERTRHYWKSWFRDMLETVVNSLWRTIRRRIAKEDISRTLAAFLKGLGDRWLRYVLDLFSTETNNLCRFFDLLAITITPECGNPCGTQGDGGADAALRGGKPFPGG